MKIHLQNTSVMRFISVGCSIFVFGVIGLFLFPSVSPAFDRIQSKSAVVVEADSGKILFAKNPEYRLFPASTTKLLTALVALEHLDLNDIVTVSKQAAEASPSKILLKEGDRISVEMLLYASLVQSANDAAIALAEAVSGSVENFVALMNMKAIELGLWNTRFVNPNGLPGDGQYATAYDLTLLMRKAIKYPILFDIMNTRNVDVWTESGKRISLKNTNKLLWDEENPLRGKTGYTRVAGHCFVGYENSGEKPLVVAVLGAPSRNVLWKESSGLVEFGARVANSLESPVVLFDSQGDDLALQKNATPKKKTVSARKSRSRSKT